MRFQHRFKTTLRIGSQSRLEVLRNSGRKHLRAARHSVRDVLRAYVGSSEWPGSAFHRICQFGSAGDPQGRTLRLGCSDKPISGSDTGVLPAPRPNAEAAWPSAAAGVIFPEHSRRDHQAGIGLCCPREHAVRTTGRRSSLLPHGEKGRLQVRSLGREAPRPSTGTTWSFGKQSSSWRRKALKHLHLGRTSLENDGLRRFKLAWGTAEETINYFRFDTRANDWIVTRDHVSGFHNTVFARLPLALNRLMGRMIYPHLD